MGKTIDIMSGDHLAIVRKWIQRKAGNGEQVTWGSGDILSLGSLSVLEMEILAQRIRDASIKEIMSYLHVCKNFEPWGCPLYGKPYGEYINYCKHCGMNKVFHNLE